MDEVRGINYRENNWEQLPWIGVKFLLASPKTLMVGKEGQGNVRNT